MKEKMLSPYGIRPATEIHKTNSFLPGSHSVNEGLPSYVPYANRKNKNNEVKTTISSPSPLMAQCMTAASAATATRTNVNGVTQPDPRASNNSIVCLNCCNEWTTNDKQKPNTANGDDYDNDYNRPSIKQWCSNCTTTNCNISDRTSTSASSSSNSSLNMSEYDECGDSSTTATTDFASGLTLTKTESVVCNRRSCIDDVTSHCAYSASDGIRVTTTRTCTKCHCTDSPLSVSRTQICAKIGASDKDACATSIPLHARIAVTHTICQQKSDSSIDDDNSRTEKECVRANDEGNATAKTSTLPFIAAEPADTATTVRISAADGPRTIKEELVAAAAAEILSDENKNCVVVNKDTKRIRRASDTTTSEKKLHNQERQPKEAEKEGESIEKHRRHSHSSSHLSHRRLRNAAAIRHKLLVKSAAKNPKSKKCKHSRRRCRCVVNVCDDNNGSENDINNWRRSTQHLKKVKTKKSVDDDNINVHNKRSERVIETSIARNDESLRSSEKIHRRAHRYNGTGIGRQSSSIVTLQNDLNRQQDESTTNGDHFESSNRLRRLEERFKDIATTKKIVQEPKDNNNWHRAAPVQRGNEDERASSALVHGRALKVDGSDNDDDGEDEEKGSVVANSDSNNNHIDASLQHHKTDVDPSVVSGIVEHKEHTSACHPFSLILDDVDELTAVAEESKKRKRHLCCQHVTFVREKLLSSSSLSADVSESKATPTTNGADRAIEKQELRKDKTVPVTIDSDIGEIIGANKNKINVDEQIERFSSDQASLKADLLLPNDTDKVNLKNKSFSSSTTTTTATKRTRTETSFNGDIRRLDSAKQTTNNNLEQINDNQDDVIHNPRPADGTVNNNNNKISASIDVDNVRLIDYTPDSISTTAAANSDEIHQIFPDACDSCASHLIYDVEDDDDEEEGIDETASSVPTNCAFDVRDLAAYGSRFNGVYECYDELESPSSAEDEYNDENHRHGHANNINNNNDENDNENDSDTCELKVPNEFNEICGNRIKFSGKYCECTVEAEIVPVYRTHGIHYHRRSTIMRDMSSSSSSTATSAVGTLRGLLKKPNRPPPLQKNRVIFDETRNEFFDADYIILIRDDCPYDEEDEEPCTCGEHELVRLCCDEGCQCTAYADDTRTPQVNELQNHAPKLTIVDNSFGKFCCISNKHIRFLYARSHMYNTPS